MRRRVPHWKKSERDFVDTFQIFPSLKKTLPVEYKLHAAALEKEMYVRRYGTFFAPSKAKAIL